MSASRFSTLFESASAYLPEIGIAVFSASIPLHLVKDPDLVEFDVILDNQHILQTGVAQQPDERFVLQIELSKEGVRLINQQLNLKSDLPLYLSIEARVVSLDGLEIISENLLELGNLTFEAVYSLAEHLGYDRDALSTLNNLRPRGDSQTRLTSSESIWKLTPNSSDISDELLDEILEILNNRIQLVFTDHVLVERAQFSLRLKSLISVDYDRLLRLVTTLGRNNVFYSALTPEVGSPIPTDAHLLLDENDILSVKLEK
ncbi:MAG: hypothetical protein LWX83_17740, partial [Anaerolineae bacterium]|nr:hypothetical protein [Anaerolineae bacterium]